MCLSHPRHRGAGVHLDKPSGATSELTVADCVIGLTPELHAGARRDLVLNGQWTGECASAMRRREVVLRLSGQNL